MDTVYEKAQRRREELRQELEKIDQFLAMLREFGEGTETQRETSEVTTQTTTGAAQETVAKLRPRRNLPKHKLAAVVRDIMVKERRKPMTRTEIVEALELKNIPVAGTDPNKAIGTILWRLRDQFVNLTGYGYWPIDIDCPQAGYTVPKEPKPNPAPDAEPDLLG